MSEEHSVEPGTPEAEPGQPLSPWAALRQAREARGLSVMDAAQHLKLTPRQVEAMEAGDMAALPGPAFARGFVRNYARYLHIDPALFAGLIEVPKDDPVQLDAIPLGKMPGPGGWRFSALPALGVAVVLLSLAVAGWHFSWFEQRDEQYVAEWMAQSAALLSAASVPMAGAESLQATPEVVVAAGAGSEPLTAVSAPAEASSVVLALVASAPSAVVSAPLPQSAPVAAGVRVAAASSQARPAASAPSADKAQSAPKAEKTQSAPKAASEPVATGKLRVLHFQFKADSWVEIRDGKGNIIFSRVNAAGSEQEIKGVPPFDMVVGNAAQVQLRQDGKPVTLNAPPNGSVARLRLP